MWCSYYRRDRVSSKSISRMRRINKRWPILPMKGFACTPNLNLRLLINKMCCSVDLLKLLEWGGRLSCDGGAQLLEEDDAVVSDDGSDKVQFTRLIELTPYRADAL